MPLLQELLAGLPDAHIQGDTGLSISAVNYDSREVQRGSAFVCIKGVARDGHEFAALAVQKGAHAIIFQDENALPELPPSIVRVRVPDTRRALALMACEFYGHPSREMVLVGVTGTNGKTTVSHLIADLLREAGYKSVGIIGTLGAKAEQTYYDTGRTTPESLDLQRLLAEFLDGGSEAVVMEVSSHALALGRVTGCAFDAGIFTNLTQDHLDFHGDMDEYFAAKTKLFTDVAAYSEQFKSYGAVFNADDRYGRRLTQIAANVPFITYGIEEPAHVKAESVALLPHRTRFIAHTSGADFPFDMGLTGRFNVSNALSAIAFGLLKNISPAVIQSTMNRTKAPEGRMEIIDEGQSFTVAVDYAHTPDGLKNVLSTVQEFTSGKIICVFGCGGDRDRTKRPQMGAIAASLSDICVVTSDNPRTEDPNRIIDDVLAGTSGSNARVFVEVDRRKAIERAVELAGSGDFVVVAGKGHETYQIFKDRTIHFDDREVVREALENLTS